jgi:hypothetical protein
MKRTDGSQNGCILPMTVILLALLALAALSIHRTALSLLREERISLHSRRAFEETISDLLEAPYPEGAERSGMLCQAGVGSAGHVTIRRELCRICRGERQLVDFNAVFGARIPCPGAIRLPDAILPFSSLPRCELNLLPPGGMVIEESIYAPEELSQSAAGALGEIDLIASAGEIRVAGEMTLRRDTILLAAGDVSIGGIGNGSGETLRLSVFSARGQISIGALSPQILINRYEGRSGESVVSFRPEIVPEARDCVPLNLHRLTG